MVVPLLLECIGLPTMRIGDLRPVPVPLVAISNKLFYIQQKV